MPPYAPDSNPSADLFVADDSSYALPEQNRRKYNVHFGLDQNRTKFIPRRTSFDRDELSQMYYNREEFQRIRESAKSVVQSIDQQWPLKKSDDEVSARGLEIFTRQGSWRKKAIGHLVRSVVLAQTKKRYKGCISSENYLAMISQQLSGGMVQEAILTGLEDEAVSLEYLCSLSTKCDDMQQNQNDYGNGSDDDTSTCVSSLTNEIEDMQDEDDEESTFPDPICGFSTPLQMIARWLFSNQARLTTGPTSSPPVVQVIEC